MAKDPYQALGVSKSASLKDIKSAYRKHAKANHPDAKPGDEAAARRFQEVATAYSILSDKDKRAAFDRGEIDGDGNPRGPFGGMGGGRHPGGGAQRGPSAEDIFAEFFGGGHAGGFSDLFGGGRAGGANPQARSPRRQGANVNYTLSISLARAIEGGEERVQLQDGSMIDVKIPAGIRDGQSIKLSGKGSAGAFGGPPGDAVISVSVRPDPRFRALGDDLETDLAVPLGTAIHGGSLLCPTVTGQVKLNIPAKSSSGKVMRLRGKGRPKKSGGRGDLLVKLLVELPYEDPAFEKFAKKFAGSQADVDDQTR
ncbi:MAG: J domain-containing protein [Pseudomonadota bacterium]